MNSFTYSRFLRLWCARFAFTLRDLARELLQLLPAGHVVEMGRHGSIERTTGRGRTHDGGRRWRTERAARSTAIHPETVRTAAGRGSGLRCGRFRLARISVVVPVELDRLKLPLMTVNKKLYIND